MADESPASVENKEQPAVEAPEVKAPVAEEPSVAASAKRKYKYEEQDIELGDDDLQAVLNEYGSFAKAIKAATSGTLKEKREFLKMTGIDPVDFAESMIADLVREELANFKPKEAAAPAAKKEPEPEPVDNTAAMQEAATNIENEIASVLEELGYSAENPAPDRLVALIAEEMLATLERDEGRINAKDAWSRVEQRTRKDLFNLAPKMKPEEFVASLPKEYVLSLQQYFVGQHAKGVLKPKQAVSGGPDQSQQPRKRSFSEEFGDVNAL
jgi:hypothetical protein